MVFMSTLLQHQVVQELADTPVLGAERCPFVEPAGFDLSGAGLLSNCFQPEAVTSGESGLLDDVSKWHTAAAGSHTAGYVALRKNTTHRMNPLDLFSGASRICDSVEQSPLTP
jgi:hypothetical protein